MNLPYGAFRDWANEVFRQHGHVCPSCEEPYDCDCEMPLEMDVFCADCYEIPEEMLQEIKDEQAGRYDPEPTPRWPRG